ncbi:MAG: class I SAM-dependent methyltransferase [Planctomycetota bacterium]|nr:class I SAM-dependent methyltransferase [Planctomycetota bacterium]
MKARFERETAGLRRSWARHSRLWLREYLVQGVEDPRINLQSILTRHFLLEQLFPGQFAALRHQELRFSTVMSWVLRLVQRERVAESLSDVHLALLEERSVAGDAGIPEYVSSTFAALPCAADGAQVPDYVADALLASPDYREPRALPGPVRDTFMRLWQGALAGREPASPIAVLEPACGSANDYRFIHASGIASFLDYAGFDLCSDNVLNAQTLFPAVNFDVGNILDIAAPDKSFDCVFVHDLFEHLSVEAMEAAFAEISRVARRALCLAFFNMSEAPEHTINPVDDYHWNTLSRARTQAALEKLGGTVEVIPIDGFLRSLFGKDDTHNKGAYTFVVRL